MNDPVCSYVLYVMASKYDFEISLDRSSLCIQNLIHCFMYCVKFIDIDTMQNDGNSNLA